MITGIDVKTEYRNRVEYFKGEGVANAITRKPRPQNDEGKDVWDITALAISNLDIDLHDYLDWCFKEAVPGIPFLNTLPGGVERFISQGKPVTLRKEVQLHVDLMVKRLKTLVLHEDPDQPITLPQDVLFDPQYEFHPVFSVAVAHSLGLTPPESVKEKCDAINKVMPYYGSYVSSILQPESDKPWQE